MREFKKKKLHKNQNRNRKVYRKKKKKNNFQKGSEANVFFFVIMKDKNL